MSLNDLINGLENKPKFKKIFKQKSLSFEVAQMIIESRILKGYTQAELALRMKTHQSSIARAEKGQYLPSLSFLEKMAVAYNTHLIAPKFGFMKNYEFSFVSPTSANDAMNTWAHSSPITPNFILISASSVQQQNSETYFNPLMQPA